MNSKVKCIIVDDEPAAHYVLMEYIEKNDSLQLVGQFYNGTNTLQYLKNNSVNLMFLDIEMPDMTGLELIKKTPNKPKTILTTAYSEFALESYEYGIVDYLLKPIAYQRFLKALSNFNSVNLGKGKEKIPDYINLKVGSDYVDVALTEILFLQSYGNYVKVFTMKKIYVATTTTSELEKRLPTSLFTRVHKSYIVALKKIDSLNKDSLKIQKSTIPIGITYRRELLERFEE